MPGNQPIPTPIYRLVHLDSLIVCLERGAIHAPSQIPADGRAYRPIHRQDIQEARRTYSISVGRGGTAHDYVPFYFGPRSVMLFQLHTGRVSGYIEGQEPLIHLVSTCQTVADQGLDFAFSDGHALARFTAWYDDLTDLARVDWDAAYAIRWNDTSEEPDRQRRKQAEFLVHRECPWNVVAEIGVYNEAAKTLVEQALTQHGRLGTIPVRIRPEWYY
jgi:hypothetical protein